MVLSTHIFRLAFEVFFDMIYVLLIVTLMIVHLHVHELRNNASLPNTLLTSASFADLNPS